MRTSAIPSQVRLHPEPYRQQLPASRRLVLGASVWGDLARCDFLPTQVATDRNDLHLQGYSQLPLTSVAGEAQLSHL